MLRSCRPGVSRDQKGAGTCFGPFAAEAWLPHRGRHCAGLHPLAGRSRGARVTILQDRPRPLSAVRHLSALPVVIGPAWGGGFVLPEIGGMGRKGAATKQMAWLKVQVLFGIYPVANFSAAR